MTHEEVVRNTDTDTLVELYNIHKSKSGVLAALGISPRHSAARRLLAEQLKNIISYQNVRTASYTDQQIKHAFSVAMCWSDVYKTLGVSQCGHNKRAILAAAANHGIHVPEFDTTAARRRGKTHRAYDQIFCEHSKVARSNLRRQVVKYNVLPYNNCNECGVGNAWNGNPLVLELDHINGVSDDNKVSNLRWLCPNCHSQTSTYKGRNTRMC